jgi:hypothetical protein
MMMVKLVIQKEEKVNRNKNRNKKPTIIKQANKEKNQ